MRTTYSNTRHPKLVKYSVIAGVLLAVACFVLYVIFDEESWARSFFHIGWFVFFYSSLMGGSYFLLKYTIDEEADTITFSEQKKYPMKISNLTTITYKESKKGKFRSLLIHDSGVGFMDIRTSKENADRITAQLTKANPAIVVNHVNYI